MREETQSMLQKEESQKDKPGRFHKIPENNWWHCDICELEFQHYQQMIGHMGAHPRSGHRTKPVGRPSNIRNKDPMAMTIIEMLETIEALRQKIIEAEEAGREALDWKIKVQSLFGMTEE